MQELFFVNNKSLELVNNAVTSLFRSLVGEKLDAVHVHCMRLAIATVWQVKSSLHLTITNHSQSKHSHARHERVNFLSLELVNNAVTSLVC